MYFLRWQFLPQFQLLHLLKVPQFSIGQMQFLLERRILHAFDGVFLREGQYLQSQFLELLSAYVYDCVICVSISIYYVFALLLTPSA